MHLLPGHVLRLNWLLLLLLKLALLWVFALGQTCTFLSALVALELALEDVEEVSVESAFEQRSDDAGEHGDGAEREEDGGQVNVFVAELQVVLHAAAPDCLRVHHRLDRVRELKLALGGIQRQLVELLQTEHLVGLVVERDLLAGPVGAGLDLEADDAHVLRLGHGLGLDDQVEVVEQDDVARFVQLANRNAVVVVLARLPVLGAAHDHRRGQLIHVEAEAVVPDYRILKLQDLVLS